MKFHEKTFNTTASPVVILNSSGEMVWTNNSFEALFGYRPADIIGTSPWPLFSVDHEKKFKSMIHHALLGNPPEPFDIPVICSDGAVRDIRWNTMLIHDAKKPEAVVAFGIETGNMPDITDRKQAEDTVKSSRKLLDNIFRAASEFSIIATDPRGIITTFNRGSELMLGYSSDEMVGKRTSLSVHLDSEVVKRSGELTSELGYPVEGFRVFVTKPELEGSETREWTYVRKDGSSLIASLVVTAMRSDSGEITGYLGISNDITLRKSMEKEAKRLAAIIRHSSELVNLSDLDGRMVFLNEAGSKMIGIDPEDMEKMNIRQVIPDHLKGLVENEVLPSLLAGGGWEGDLQYKNLKTGELTDVHALTFTIDDPDAPHLRYLANVSRDITERKKAEEESRLSEEKFMKIFMTTPDCIVISRIQNGLVIDVNRGFEEISGWKRDEVLGRSTLDLNVWANAADRDRMVEDLMAGRDILHRETLVRRKEGIILNVIYSARPIRIAGEMCLIFVMQDITERKRAEESIRNSLEEKELLLKELYHRTKNNMQVVCGLLQLQSARVDDPVIHDFCTEIQTKIETMALVHQKLYESKDLTNIDLRDFVNSLSDLMMKSYAMPQEKLTINQSVDNVPLSIDMAMPLGLVLNELISNSIKHAFLDDRNGEILIDMHCIGENIRIEYRDNGVGLPEGFNPTATPTLGMHIIQNISKKQLGGDIRFINEKGFGCIINFKTNLYQRRI